MKLLAASLLILMFSLSTFCQSILTNDDVVEMVKSGLSAEIIVAKINASETKFDTSTAALLKLSDAKVPNTVIVSMLDKEKSQREKTVALQKEETTAKDSIPEQGTLVDIVGMKRVFVLTEFIKARDLIVKELEKEKTLTVVDKIEDSDFVVRYKEEVIEIGATGSVYGNTGTVRNLTELVGILSVIMRSKMKDADRLRFIYSTKKSKYYIWESHPAQSSTKQFLKDLKKISKN